MLGHMAPLNGWLAGLSSGSESLGVGVLYCQGDRLL